MCQRFVFAQQRILAPGAGHRCHPVLSLQGMGVGRGRDGEPGGLGCSCSTSPNPCITSKGA